MADLTLTGFWRSFTRVNDERTRRLVQPEPHAEQARFLAAFDALDAAGAPMYRELVLSWPKKSAKSTTAAAVALWGLVGDGWHADREVLISSCDEEQSMVVFGLAAKMVRRHPWLRQHVRILAKEMIFTEAATEPRTGGTYAEEHVLRALPRDVRGSHGTNASLTVHDEVWAADDHAMFEALAPSPTRRCPRTLYTSYAGLVSQQHPGVPWFDLLERARRGDDPTVFLSELRGPEAWRAIPWITPRWVEGLRRQFAAVPSRFKRLVWNVPSASDHSFLSVEEVRDAVDAGLGPVPRVDPGAPYVLGVDLGLTHDWTALALVHLDRRRRAIVDVVRSWRGTRAQPVALARVEDAIVELARRFPVQTIVMDAWQSAYLAQRLRDAGVRGVRTTTIDPAHLDRLATLLKGVFAERAIRIPASARDLIAQLETLEGAEMGAKNRRRDKLRFTSGAGTGAAAHDDLAIALALALEVVEDRRRGLRAAPLLVAIRSTPAVEVSHVVAMMRRRKTAALMAQLAAHGGDPPDEAA